MTIKTGLDALVAPERSALLLIDHQPFQFSNLHSHEPMLIVNNVMGLAKAAKAFNVPTILTAVTEERGGYLLKGIQDVFPTQKPVQVLLDRVATAQLSRRRFLALAGATGLTANPN